MSRSDRPLSSHGRVLIGVSWYRMSTPPDGTLSVAACNIRCDLGRATSAIELHFRAAPGCAGLLVDCDRRGAVLQRRPRAVKDGDLVVAGAARTATDNHFGELRMHLRACHP